MPVAPLCSQANGISFLCLLSEPGWTGHQWRRHCSCHWRKWGWVVDSREEWAARLCARVLPWKALMKRRPSPQTFNVFYYWKQTAHKVCFSWPRATHNTVFYIHQTGNNQLTTFSSSFLLRSASTPWPTLSAKTICTSETLGLVFLTTVLSTLSTLCCQHCKSRCIWEENPAQNLPSALKRSRQHTVFPQDGGSPPARLWATLTVTVAVLCHGSPPLAAQARQAFLTVALKAHSGSR